MLLGVGRELLTKCKFDHNLLAAGPKQGRQSRDENRHVCEKCPNHRAILEDIVRQIESDYSGWIWIGCLVRRRWSGDRTILGDTQHGPASYAQAIVPDASGFIFRTSRFTALVSCGIVRSSRVPSGKRIDTAIVRLWTSIPTYVVPSSMTGSFVCGSAAQNGNPRLGSHPWNTTSANGVGRSTGSYLYLCTASRAGGIRYPVLGERRRF